MRELYKVKAKELNASESFYLYFWGNDKRDAVSLAAEVCTKDKLEMLCIFQRLEATLNGSTEYLEEEKEEEKPSDQYIEMEKARDTLNRWLEINK